MLRRASLNEDPKVESICYRCRGHSLHCDAKFASSLVVRLGTELDACHVDDIMTSSEESAALPNSQ